MVKGLNPLRGESAPRGKAIKDHMEENSGLNPLRGESAPRGQSEDLMDIGEDVKSQPPTRGICSSRRMPTRPELLPRGKVSTPYAGNLLLEARFNDSA